MGNSLSVRLHGTFQNKREESWWERVAEKYPPGSVVQGKVRNIANYGAFVEIEEGIDGLLYVSDLSWIKKIGHTSDVL